MNDKMCCEMMERNSKNHCEVHDNPFECNDCFIYYDETKNCYGIILHDGTESYIKINNCPWCGKNFKED